MYDYNYTAVIIKKQTIKVTQTHTKNLNLPVKMDKKLANKFNGSSVWIKMLYRFNPCTMCLRVV